MHFCFLPERELNHTCYSDSVFIVKEHCLRIIHSGSLDPTLTRTSPSPRLNYGRKFPAEMLRHSVYNTIDFLYGAATNSACSILLCATSCTPAGTAPQKQPERWTKVLQSSAVPHSKVLNSYTTLNAITRMSHSKQNPLFAIEYQSVWHKTTFSAPVCFF